MKLGDGGRQSEERRIESGGPIERILKWKRCVSMKKEKQVDKKWIWDCDSNNKVKQEDLKKKNKKWKKMDERWAVVWSA